MLKQNSNFAVDEVPTIFFTLFEDNPKVADAIAHLKPGTSSNILMQKTAII